MILLLRFPPAPVPDIGVDSSRPYQNEHLERPPMHRSRRSSHQRFKACTKKYCKAYMDIAGPSPLSSAQREGLPEFRLKTALAPRRNPIVFLEATRNDPTSSSHNAPMLLPAGQLSKTKPNHNFGFSHLPRNVQLHVVCRSVCNVVASQT